MHRKSKATGARLNALSAQILWRFALLTLTFPTWATYSQDEFPIFEYAIFYNKLMEFTWCSPMTINGPVHGNGNMYTGSAFPLTFNGKVEIVGTISSPAWYGKQPSQYSSPTVYKASYITNAPYWALPIGVDPYSSVASRQILEIPPPGGDTSSVLARSRYYNLAQVAVLVSNSTITAIIKTSMFDTSSNVLQAAYYPTNNNASNYTGITASFPFLSVTNYWATNPVPMIDQREHATLKLTDIDMGALKHWLFTNALVKAKFPSVGGVYSNSMAVMPNVLYVADNRSYATGQLTAVRLRNASIIPTNLFTLGASNVPSGFTVATPNPLYIYGNYNCPNPAHLGTTNTSAAYPAALLCDALTILSGNWQDSQSSIAMPSVSGNGNGKNMAVSTTVNAAIIAGIVSSTGPGANQFSGGVPNLPRLLEDWGSGSYITLALNTSLVNVFDSGRATNQWRPPGEYYFSPVRQFSYDSSLQLWWKWPPGTPGVFPGAPKITSDPQPQRVGVGRTATFTATVTGTGPLCYQWGYTSGSPFFPWYYIAGATNATFTIPSVDPTNAGFYFLTISNVYGWNQTASVPLSIGIPPSVQVQPLSQTAPTGGVASFTVVATGETPLNYQWRFNGALLLNATNAAFIVSNVQAALSGDYTVIVSNPAGWVTSAIAKLSLANPPDFLWARNPSSSEMSASSRVDSVAADSSGNVYVAGSFAARTMDFGGQTLTNNSWVPGKSANFLVRYSGGGSLLWAMLLGTNSGAAYPLRVITDANGGACVAGRYSGLFRTANPEFVFDNQGEADQFIIKVNSSGWTFWGQHIGYSRGVSPPAPYGLALDNSNNVLISGQYTNSVHFYGGPILTNGTSFVAVLPYYLGNSPLFAWDVMTGDSVAPGTNGSFFVAGSPGLLAQYSASGSLLWSRPFPIAQSMVSDARQNIYLTGYGAGTFDGLTLTNSGGDPDFFVARCYPSGRLQWLRQLGGIQKQRGTAIALDSFNNVFVTSATTTGRAEPLIQVGPTTLTNVFTLAAKYDPAGNPLWAQAIASANPSTMYGLAVKNPTNAFVGGSFSGTASLGQVTLQNTNGCPDTCAQQMFVAKLFSPVANGPINITTQPQNQTVVPGADAAFSIAVSSTFAVGYQWYYNLTNAITDGTNATLVLSSLQPADSGSYSVIISNLYGTTNSVTAKLIVVVAPVITAGPQDLLVPSGKVAAFGVSATGTAPLNYQWQFDGTNLPTATNATLVLSNISTAQAGQYIVTVTNLAASASAAANLAIALPPLLQPLQNQLVLAGQDVIFSAFATGTGPLVWQWRFNGVDLQNATNSALSLNGVSFAQAGTYSVTVTNLAGSATASATLTLAVPPSPGQPLHDLTVARGQSATFATLITGSEPFAYQWLFNGTNILDATNATLVLTNLAAGQSGEYAVIITNLAGAITNTATLTVAEVPTIDTPPQNIVILAGQDAVFSVAASGTGPLAYQWQFNGADLPNASDSTLILPNISPGQTGQYSVTVTNLVGSASATATLTLAVPPSIDLPFQDAITLAGQDLTLTVTASGTAPLAYQWQFNGTNLLDATESTLTLTNMTDEQAGEYTVTVTNLAGSATSSATLTIAVAPTIEVPLQNLTLVAGQSVALNLTAAGTPPPSYSWQFNGTILPDASGATLTLTNISLDQAGQYVVTATNMAGCATSSATLSVYASAAATLSALPSASDGRFQFTVSGVPGFTYIIQVSTNFIDWDPLLTNTSPFSLTDDEITNYPARFYRSVYVP